MGVGPAGRKRVCRPPLPKRGRSPMADEVLRMQNITKIYSNGFIANRDVNLVIQKNEIHGLVGENGAGKTTLMKMLFGMEIPNEGTIFINGKEEKIANPLDAIHKGVGMVHQHFMLLPSLTVAENVTLGVEPIKNGLYDFEKAVADAGEAIKAEESAPAVSGEEAPKAE